MAGFQKSSQMTRETLRYFDAINCKNAEVGDIFSCQRMLKEQWKRVSEEAHITIRRSITNEENILRGH